MMHFYAQVTPEQAAEVIKGAASHGWEAGLLVLVFLTAGGLLVALIKTWMTQAATREERMSKRIESLEDFIRQELKLLAVQCREALEKNTAAFARLEDALENRPCFWSPEKQEKIIRESVCKVKCVEK